MGTRLAEILVQQGREVRCLVHASADASELLQLGVEIRRGDLRHAAILADICDGADTVLHCAGVIHPRRVAEFEAVNASGTRNLVEAAARAEVRRFIHISSNSAVGYNVDDNRLMLESDPPRPYRGYGRSKLAAERIVEEACRNGRIESVILRPCWFYGIRQPSRQTALFKMIATGRPLLFGDGTVRRSLSYVDNVIDAVMLAETNDRAIGKTYWIADERPYSMDEIYRTVAELLGVRDYRPLHLPLWTSRLAEIGDGLLQRAGLYITELHVAGELCRSITCSIERARHDLGYAPRVALREGMRRSIEWCREHGVRL